MTDKQNYKTVYLSLNSSYSHFNLTYRQLKNYSSLFSPNFTWKNLEYTIKDNINEILLDIFKESPDILISTVYLFNKNILTKIAKKIKVLIPDLTIVFGGPEFLGDNRKFLISNPETSAVFRGDESSFYKFLNEFRISKNWDKIPGICFIDDKNKYIDKSTTVFSEQDLDMLPSIYDEELPIDKPFMSIETSRGCFSKCSFCTSSKSEKVQFYSIKRVKSDLNKITSADFKEIRVLDRTFNLPVNRAYELIKIFINEYSDIRFHLEFDPTSLDYKIIEILRTAPGGQFHIEAGVQSLYEPSLRYIKRFDNILKTKENLQLLCSLKNIDIHTDLIFGLPLQTEESIFNDLNELINIAPQELQFENLKILPGTPIVDNISKTLKHSPLPPYEVLSTNELGIETILKFCLLSRLIDCYYNVKDFQNIIKYAIYHDLNFLKSFLNFSKKYFSKPEKPSIKKRFEILFKYTNKTKNNALFQLILFTYFKNGFFNKPEAILIKRNEFGNINSKIRYVVWNINKKLLEKPVYLAEFDYNIGEIWLNHKTVLRVDKSIYLFQFSQIGQIKQVSKISRIGD